MTTIKNTFFKKLIKKLELQTGSNLDLIGYESKHFSYEMSFYGDEEDNYQLNIENFGISIGGKWKQLKPTEQQFNQLQKILTDKSIEIQEELSHNHSEENDMDETYAFIDANFHTKY